MLDIKLIRKDLDGVLSRLQSRGAVSSLDQVLELDERRRALIFEGDGLRNVKSTAEIGMRTVDRVRQNLIRFVVK